VHVLQATGPFGGDLHALRTRVCTNDYSAAGARRSLAASLARLGALISADLG